jgi:hypothetical protein
MIHSRLAAFVYPCLLAAFTVAQTAESPVQGGQLPPRVKVVFPEGVPYDKVWVGYGLFGPSGGRRYFDVPRPSGTPSYEVEAVVDGNAVNRFKALVWAPGCKMKEFDVSVGTSNVELAFACEALKTVTLVGRVQLVDLGGKTGTISVAYDSVGPCLFLSTCTDGCFFDCMGPAIPKIATGQLKADGTFKIELPDFSADPIASGFRDAGFDFLAHGARWIHLEPEAKEFRSSRIGLRVAPSYPSDLLFVPHQWN